MKLLLDENLSRRLVPFLQEAYPGSSQVVLLGLEQASSLSGLKNRSENSAGRGQILTISPGNSRSIAQESGEI